MDVEIVETDGEMEMKLRMTCLGDNSFSIRYYGWDDKGCYPANVIQFHNTFCVSSRPIRNYKRWKRIKKDGICWIAAVR